METTTFNVNAISVNQATELKNWLDTSKMMTNTKREWKICCSKQQIFKKVQMKN